MDGASAVTLQRDLFNQLQGTLSLAVRAPSSRTQCCTITSRPSEMPSGVPSGKLSGSRQRYCTTPDLRGTASDCGPKLTEHRSFETRRNEDMKLLKHSDGLRSDVALYRNRNARDGVFLGLATSHLPYDNRRGWSLQRNLATP
jgi:hypothetical protein